MKNKRKAIRGDYYSGPRTEYGRRICNPYEVSFVGKDKYSRKIKFREIQV